MARTKSLEQKKHRKVLKMARGYRQARRSRYKSAKEAVLHAGQYAFSGRKLRKRDMRKLWIARISAAAKLRGSNYNRLMSALKKADIALDRKVLAELAMNDPKTFESIFELASNPKK